MLNVAQLSAGSTVCAPDGSLPIRAQLEQICLYADNAAKLFGSQPWRLVVTDTTIEVHALMERRLRAIDLDGRESLIAAGSAIFMLKLALKCHHILPEVEHTPNSRQPGLLARLRVVGRTMPSSDELELFSLLTGVRGDSESAVAPGFHPLKRAACDEGVSLRYVEGCFLRTMTGEMLQTDDRLLYQRAADCVDFRAWLGIGSLSASESSDLVGWIVTEDELRQARAEQPALTSGDFAVICTRRDDEVSWLKTGMALGHAYLAAEAAGMVVSVFNQPLQVPGMRARFARETGFCNFPQVILRISVGVEHEDCGCGCGEER